MFLFFVNNSLVKTRFKRCELFYYSNSNRNVSSMTSLISLDLSNNHLRDLPLDTFHKMTLLRNLYLQVNTSFMLTFLKF
jgi:hypothetical protein